MYNFYSIFALSFLIGTTVEKNCTVTESKTIQCNYFPYNISEAISRVKIVDFVGPKDNIEINSSYFEAEGWRHVKYLEISNLKDYDNDVIFSAGTFSSLKLLNELGIHLPRVTLDPDIFVRVNSIETLNVKDCIRLSLNDLLQTFNETYKIQGLTRLIMSRMNEYSANNTIDERFGHILQQKKLSYLDMSYMIISKLHLDVLKYLKFLRYYNISGASIADIILRNFNYSYMKNVDFDMSHAIYTKKLLPSGKLEFIDLTLKPSESRILHYAFFAQANTANISFVILQTDIWLKNITVLLDKPLNVFLRRLILRGNNIRWFDVKLVSIFPRFTADLEEIDLSDNGMQLINPSGKNFAPKLKIINMSSNQLHKMAKTNITMFEMLFYSLSRLQVISLSSNGLTTIPVSLFRDNFALKSIDLSGNKLEQVTFSLSHLRKLEILDLQRNSIHVLSQESLSRLNSLLLNSQQNRTQEMSVMLSNNPILCSKCETKVFLQWLITSRLVKAHLKRFRCKQENGRQSPVNKHTLQDVQDICDRLKIIVISCVWGLVAVAMISFVVALSYRYWRKQLTVKKRRRIVQLLRKGENRFKFVAFLAYCGHDETLANYNFFDMLNEYLKFTTGIGREMVCSVDRNITTGNSSSITSGKRCSISSGKSTSYGTFDNTKDSTVNNTMPEGSTAGQSILQFKVNCLNNASVMVVVMSETYCEEKPYPFELDMACSDGKPIVVMLEECVDEEKMDEVMRQICKTSTQILWKRENDNYILNSTWDSVATSIVDLIKMERKEI